MEKLFQLRANGTSVRTEILAGLTTFMTMAYIIALNPNLLTNFDTGSALWNGVFLATCIASAIAMLLARSSGSCMKATLLARCNAVAVFPHHFGPRMTTAPA